MAEADTDKNKFIREIDSAIRIFKTNPQKPNNKDALFKKLFELMTFECGQIWADVLRSDKYTQKLKSNNLIIRINSLLVQLQDIFYSKSKWIKMDGSKDFDDKNEPIKDLARLAKESYRIEPIPSKLFLEFLLFVATQIRDSPLRTDTTQLVCLGELVRRSDQESVLNIAQENERFFMITTEPTTREIFQQILDIYTTCGVRFSGNISISHIIGQLCEGMTGSVTQTESSQSPDKPLEVRSEMEQIFINSPSLLKADVQKSLPVKGGITKPAITTPASSSIKADVQKSLPVKGGITKPAITTPASSSIKARPDTTIKRPAAVPVKPICPHDVKCYRRHNRQHEEEYSHPDKKPIWKPGGGSGKSTRTQRRRTATKSKRTQRRRHHRTRTRRN
jgi:hypothetical protein